MTMIYAKVDVVLPRHHRMQAIDRASALGVYIAALCHTREHALNGFVPMAAFRGFPTHKKQDVDDLIRVGLFELAERDGAKGVNILKYADKNETKDVIDVRRAEAAERMRLVRANKKRTSSEHPPNAPRTSSARSLDVPDSDSICKISSSDPLSSFQPSSSQPAGNFGETEDSGNREQDYQRAYETGIREGLSNGAGYAMPENQRGALHQAMLAHSEKRKGEALLEWIQAAAADFAEDMRRRPSEQKFYSSLGPRGLLKWLNDRAMSIEGSKHP